MAGIHASQSIRRWTAACFVIAIVVTIQFGFVGPSRASSAPANPPPAVVGVPAGAMLVPVSGTVTMVNANLVGLIESHASSAVGFNVDAGTRVTRDGASVPVSALQAGDQVAMTVDARTGKIVHLLSGPAGFAWQRWLNIAGPLASIALGAALIMVIVRRWNLMPRLRLALPRLPESTADAFRHQVAGTAVASIETPAAPSHA